MLKYLFAFIILLHGLIHLMGFAKAFNYGNIAQLTKMISRPQGLVWLLTTFLFIAVTVFFLLRHENWWIIGLTAAVVSQVLILTVWKDAKFGSIANLIIIIVAILYGGSVLFESTFKKDVKECLRRTNVLSASLLTNEDISPLPEPVKRYLVYTGALNKPKVKNMRIVFEGQMREKGKDYFPFVSEQYNFFDEPTRLFFMKAKMKGIIVPGYHRYTNATANMDIRLFGLFPVVKESGSVMNKTETVTLFNDMCLLAPATLIDQRIKWETIDSTTVKAIFTNQGITITAILFFNNEGKLINFVSNDRTAISDMKEHPFFTPVSAYKNINGINVMSKGEAVYEYEDGKFTYGIFNLKSIEYNLSEMK